MNLSLVFAPLAEEGDFAVADDAGSGGGLFPRFEVFHMLIGSSGLLVLIQNVRCVWCCLFANPQHVEEILDRFHVGTAHPDYPPCYTQIARPMIRNRLPFRFATLHTAPRWCQVPVLQTSEETNAIEPRRKLSAHSLKMLFGLGLMLALFSGCGTTKEQQATEQLLLSDAVDRSVSTIDFRPLSGEKVYLDTSYLRSVKATTFVNADYVTSALRQQVIAAGC